MIPEYITEPISILDDSVLEIAEKLAFKAHEGKYVEGLWDASASTMVSKLPDQPDWQPLELELHAGDLQNSYDPEVSEVPQFCRVSGLNPFFGYMSEPPIAPAFREEKPIGIATPALQALATMVSLLQMDQQDQQIRPLIHFFCQMWGINPGELQNIELLQPSLINRSQLDLIKSTRAKSHRLYGYENEQNYVSVRGGGYTHSSLNQRRYVDWHRINIVLRYIGTYLLASDPMAISGFRGTNFTIYYGLVGREFPLVTGSPHLCQLANMSPAAPNINMSAALSHAIAYYSSERVVTAIAQRNLINSTKVQLPEDFQVSDIALATLRANLNRPQKGLRLDLKVRAEPKYDISKPGAPMSGQSLPSLLDKLDIHHQISPRRALELLMIAKILATWNTQSGGEMRDLKDLIRLPTQLDDDTRLQAGQQIAALLGRRSGFTLWTIMKKFRTDMQLASDDFLTFCAKLQGRSLSWQITNKPDFFWEAIHSDESPKLLMSIFNSAFGKSVSLMNQPTLPKGIKNPAISGVDALTQILHHLWKKKQEYWIGHYKQRRSQWTDWMSRHPNAISQVKSRKKGELIRYQWLVRWLSYYVPRVQEDLSVWPEIPNVHAINLLSHTENAFLRKRNQESSEPDFTLNYKQLARQMDSRHKPKLSFLSLTESVHKTAKEMSRDIALIYRRLSEPHITSQDVDPLGTMYLDSLENANPEELKWGELCEAIEPNDMLQELDEEDTIEDLSTPKLLQEPLGSTSFRMISGAAAPSTDVMGDEEIDALLPELGDADFGGMFNGPSEEEALAFLSPLADLTEKTRKLPDLIQWANAAQVPLAKLNKCLRSEYEPIYLIGQTLAKDNGSKEADEEISYDVK